MRDRLAALNEDFSKRNADTVVDSITAEDIDKLATITPYATGASMKDPAVVDPLIGYDYLRDCARKYLGAADPRDPLASPLFAELEELGARYQRITGSMTARWDTIPIFTAPISRSEKTASICAATNSAGTSWIAVTPLVFCAVSAVMTEAP